MAGKWHTTPLERELNVMPSSTERLNLSITTSSGDLQAQIDVPTGFIPITKIVPLMRSLGDQAQELEIAKTLQAGKTISCQKGCAACCRPMIPVSPPEAFALVEAIKDLPQDHQSRIKQNLAKPKSDYRRRDFSQPSRIWLIPPANTQTRILIPSIEPTMPYAFPAFFLKTKSVRFTNTALRAVEDIL